jgi:hypothetical protein
VEKATNIARSSSIPVVIVLDRIKKTLVDEARIGSAENKRTDDLATIGWVKQTN